MPAIVNPADIAKIAVISFVFILLANKAIRAAGFNSFTTSGA